MFAVLRSVLSGLVLLALLILHPDLIGTSVSSLSMSPKTSVIISKLKRNRLVRMPPKQIVEDNGITNENEMESDDDYGIQSRRAFVGGAAIAAVGACCAFCATGRPGGEDKQRIFARAITNGMQDYEAHPEVVAVKSNLFSHVRPKATVLEIGVGGGTNFKYYGPKADRIMALEPNREFDDYMFRSLRASGVDPSKLDILPGVAESIPIADASVDVVVGTMVLCSVKSVKDSLQEIYRVLKPGGRYLMTEHIAAPTARTYGGGGDGLDRNHLFLSAAQIVYDPLQQIFAEGCHLRRDPYKDVVRTFGRDNILHSDRFVLGDKNDDGIPPPHFLLSPHLVMVATKTEDPLVKKKVMNIKSNGTRETDYDKDIFWAV